MQRNCIVKGCINEGRYCRLHFPGTAARNPQPIAKESEKRKVINQKVYKTIVKELKKKTHTCQINSPVCIKKPVHPHHLKGRIGQQLTKKEDMIMACDPCNGYIEAHPTWAKALGFKKSKNESNYQRVK